jgi:hypothetical protein
VVTKRIAEAKLEGLVQTAREAVTLRDGTTAWVVTAIWVDLAAWQAMVDRLGWQIYVSNTTPDQYDVPALVAAYHQQPVHERTFSRLKTRNLRPRPVFLRDETRIAGLVWLLCLALRVLVLTEQRLRAAIMAQFVKTPNRASIRAVCSLLCCKTLDRTEQRKRAMPEPVRAGGPHHARSRPCGAV